MTKPETSIDYGRRLARVSEHIAEHLDDPLDLERLSAIAHFSPWHFHRIYRETVGETAADTVRRLRLHRAAVELIREGTPLEKVARRAGYGSLAAFSRAFAADYGMPPGSYRLRGRLIPPNPRKEAPAMLQKLSYDVTIEPFPAVRLAAIDHHGDYQEIGRIFDQVFAWAGGRGLLGPQTRSLGIYYDDPHTVPVKELRSAAGIVVAADVVIDGELRAIDIPPLLCASVVHNGPYAELERPYEFLYREWLPQSGREPADHPCFEEYLNNPRELPPSEWLTRIFLPVRE